MPSRTRFNSLFARLLVGAGFPMVLFVAVALVGLMSIAELHRSLREVDHTHEVIELMLGVREDYAAAQLAHRNLVRAEWRARALGQPTPDGDADRAVGVPFENLQTHLAALRGKVADNHSQAERVEAILASVRAWRSTAEESLRRVRALGPGPDFDRAMDAELSRLLPMAGVTDQQMIEFVSVEQAILADRRARAEATESESVWLIEVIGVAGLALAVFTVWYASRSVTEPVERLREAAANLVAGRFEVIRPEGPDEIAELTVHFNHTGLIVTERAESLREQNETYQQYLGRTAHVLWATDARGEVAGDLPTWRAFTGQSAEEVLGSGWLDAVHPDDREAVRAGWGKAVEDCSDFEAEYRLRREDGEYRPFLCRAVPILTRGGAVREWVGTCIDVTERQREELLRLEKEAAEAANRAKTEFLTKMSHELRTPLNAVIGMSRMLTTRRFGPLNVKQADYVQDISSAGAHLLTLINDILDLSRVDAGKMEVRAEEFSLGEVIARAGSALRPLAEQKGLELRAPGPEPEGAARTDPRRLRQILDNLLSNAIKFTDRGRVEVETRWVEAAARGAAEVPADRAAAFRVSVCDTGVGIPAAEQAAVWDEFTQSSASRLNAVQGTGLGLALTRRLVELLGGSIWMESESGKGSIFTFALPRDLPAPADAVTARWHDDASDRPLTLIIEDHAPTRKLLEDWLEDVGVATESAADGPTGLARAAERTPALILLDLMLPGMHGWDVLAELKRDPRTESIPVVVVTVNEDRGFAADLGVREFFVKPIDRDDFLGRLREVVPSLFAPG